MGANSEVFLRMSEEYYLKIPQDIRAIFLSSKRVGEDKSDFSENIKDDIYSELYKKSKEIKKQLSEREFYLREKRRKLK